MTPKPKSRKLSVKKLLDGVTFHPDDVVEAAARNSVLFVDAMEYRLSCMEARAVAELASKRVEAEQNMAVRKRYKDAGEKITEDAVKALTVLDPKVRKVNDDEATAVAHDEYSKLVVEVFRMRRDCLRIVSDMTREGERSQRRVEQLSETMAEHRKELRSKFPGDV